MLSSFKTKHNLQVTRNELQQGLYQHDAACRAIAKLTKEAVAAREALALLKPQPGSAPTNIPQPVSSIFESQIFYFLNLYYLNIFLIPGIAK